MGGGAPDVACQILKTALSHVIVARKMAMPLSIIRICPVAFSSDFRPHVACRIKENAMSFVPRIPMSPVDFKNTLCRPVEFKKRPCRSVDFGGLDPY